MSELSFTTKIDNVDIDGLENHLPALNGKTCGDDFEIENVSFTVDWTLSIDARGWGVKDICWHVDSIDGVFDVVMFDEKGDEASSEQIEFEFAPFAKTTTFEMDIDYSSSICPTDLHIDYLAKEISVAN